VQAGCEGERAKPSTGAGTGAALAPAGQREAPPMPMACREADSTEARWLSKKVSKSRLLDDMEDLGAWRLMDSRSGGAIGLSDQRSKDGRYCLRLLAPTKGTTPSDGNPFGSVAAVRRFQGEDWTTWNRLSFWVFPNMPGHHSVSLSVSLLNAGGRRGPGTSYFLLRPGRWNHVVWEISDVGRDNVRGLLFRYTMNGNEPGTADVAQLDFDHIEIQSVEPDLVEGWAVAPRQIAFCHTGYPRGGPKAAFASGLVAEEFELIDTASGKAVLRKPVRTIEAPTGPFAVLDFSEHQAEGTYRLRAGKIETRPFRIAADVWRRTLWKALNFLYVQRCGFDVPGVHGVCHADWRARHGDKTIVINGGWHDAGDMSQGPVNTGEVDFALFDLFLRLRRAGQHGPLADRVLEEARWGLAWLMKTTFHDGYRVGWAEHRFWSNNRLGDVDDVTIEPRRDPENNLHAAAAEALAANVLKDIDPNLAGQALAAAREDLRFGAAGLDKGAPEDLPVDRLGVATMAAVELHRATGEKAYADQARQWAHLIVAC